MSYENLKTRYRDFGISIIKFCQGIPRSVEMDIIKRQIIRSATSTGANYRAACRAKSAADFVNKMKIVEEEMDETMYWLEVMKELNQHLSVKIDYIYKEANELLSITVASINTSRRKIRTSKNSNNSTLA